MSTHRDLMDEWFRRVWCENDVAFIHETCSAEMSTEGHREKGLMGPSDFERFRGIIAEHTDNSSMRILRSVEEGDWISVMYEFTGTKKGTDIPVQMTGNSMIRIQGGQIAEVYEHVDYMKFFACLGIMPGNALEHCLCGNAMHI